MNTNRMSSLSLLLVALLAGAASPAVAADLAPMLDFGNLEMVGKTLLDRNAAFITQDGISNQAIINQAVDMAGAYGNYAEIDQSFGNFNVARIDQAGANNKVRVDQSGSDNNTVSVTQTGYNNVANLVQLGGNNQLTLVQDGNFNVIHFTQNGGSSAELTQTGNGNILDYVQPSLSVAKLSVTGGLTVTMK